MDYDNYYGNLYRVYGIDTKSGRITFESKYPSYEEAKDELDFRTYYKEPSEEYFLEEVC